MGFQTKSIPQQNGGWLKPAEHNDDAAILIEIKGLDRQRPTPNGPKDSVLADLTFFKSAASLDKGTPDEIVKGTRIEQSVLARDLFAMDVGDAVVSTVTQIPSKKQGQNPAWVWKSVSKDVEGKVVAYGEAREAAIDAELGDVPDFGSD